MVVVVLVRRALTPLTKLLVELHPPALPSLQLSPVGHQNLNHSSVAQTWRNCSQSTNQVEVQNEEGLPFLHSVIVNSVMDNVKN